MFTRGTGDGAKGSSAEPFEWFGQRFLRRPGRAGGARVRGLGVRGEKYFSSAARRRTGGPGISGCPWRREGDGVGLLPHRSPPRGLMFTSGTDDVGLPDRCQCAVDGCDARVRNDLIHLWRVTFVGGCRFGRRQGARLRKFGVSRADAPNVGSQIGHGVFA
jgi:hypothetical protein